MGSRYRFIHCVYNCVKFIYIYVDIYSVIRPVRRETPQFCPISNSDQTGSTTLGLR